MIILHYYWLDLINHNYFILSTILDLFSDNILLIGTEKNVSLYVKIYICLYIYLHIWGSLASERYLQNNYFMDKMHFVEF